ncbi:MAG TPA: glycosyltransferase [Thermoleophilaceae bacterium]
MTPGGRRPVLYLAPWVDYGGTDKGTIDWFRWLDRDRYAPSLIATQPSLNRRLSEVIPYAEEVWALSELMRGSDFPGAIFDFIHTRGIDVVHIMNSRMGYDLLPDLAALPKPPAVVVQLHVEEQDKSGYVRYVTTRYGNLVDAFSVTSEHLANAVSAYDVPRAKTRVIYTGVDAEQEFNPERVRPIDGIEQGPVHILYPGRLVPQKDPLLMVEVIAALAVTGSDFRVHVVGEGQLEPAVHEAVRERGLERFVRFYPPTNEIARWFAACDLLLMTSVFEGVPYVVFEAMAMGVPIVAPALPGNAELMDGEAGALIDPRDDVGAYVRALAELVGDDERRRELGWRARRRVQERFSLQRMAADHADLYDELLAGRAKPAKPDAPVRHELPEPLRLRGRPSRGQPPVSVIVPCFNHGRYLPECLASIREQSYDGEIQTIVVDDGSTDPETVELLTELERGDDVEVLRMSENSGPSAARNAALERACGRFVLPVDADNLLLPEALEKVVGQLQNAGETVGYVYPSPQYFGNRLDWFRAPEFNLHRLLDGNFADTSSLLDRQIFDAGFRYPEVGLGHEDWDFALSLAEHEVSGEPARERTLLYRKRGFTRSDLVEYAADEFKERLPERHGALYERAADAKSRWSPALSIVTLRPVDPEGESRGRLGARVFSQSCSDFELIVRSDTLWPDPGSGPHLRRIPAQLARSASEALQTGWHAARGRYMLVTAGTGSELLADPAFVEKVLRVFSSNAELQAIGLTDAGEKGRFPLRLIEPGEGIEPEPHAIVWRADCDELMPPATALQEGRELASLATAVSGLLVTQWRHAPAPPRFRPDATGGVAPSVQRPSKGRPSEAEDRRYRLEAAPALPRVPGGVRRWSLSPTWMPPGTLPLVRHASRDGLRRIVTRSELSPPGFSPEFHLGMAHAAAVPGTVRLEWSPAPDYAAVAIERPEGDPEFTLGYLELAAFPLLQPLILARHGASGQHVVVAGHGDPLLAHVESLGTLGFAESWPVSPRRIPHARLDYGLLGLVRTVDLDARTHRYGVGAVPPGTVAGELGSLHIQPGDQSIPVWLSADGVFSTDRYTLPSHAPGRKSAAKWAVAPLAWRGSGPLGPRVRAAVRRGLTAVSALSGGARAEAERQGAPVGYLHPPDTAVESVPLYSAWLPVTGDQLLTSHPLEAADMGYVETTLLGSLLAAAPMTGRLGVEDVGVPWASRFGHNARRS